MKPTVLIPTKNRIDLLYQTVKSLLSNLHVPYEIIIVDQGNYSKTYEMLNQFEKNKSIIKHFQDTNTGASKARSMGLRNVTGDIIACIDDDCEIG